MDEALKALMLLNSVFADARALDVMKSRSIDMKDLWNASAEGIAGVVLTQNAVSRLRQNEASGWAEREYERCLSLGTDIVAYGGKRYPKQLCDLKDAPLILYWRGKARSLPAASAAAARMAWAAVTWAAAPAAAARPARIGSTPRRTAASASALPVRRRSALP